ncbi:MAG: hypothetical protein U0231_08900 [Nitrospiraceae bacterium]
MPISTFYNQPGFPRDQVEGPLVDVNGLHKFNDSPAYNMPGEPLAL